MSETSMIAWSALVQAGATVVLVIVTVLYVRLTRTLVTTSREQLSDARAILDAQTGIGRSRLRALVTQVLESLAPLPDDRLPESEIRTIAIWSEKTEQDLVTIAASLGSPLADLAREAAPALSWIRSLHSRITVVPREAGYHHSQSEGDEYIVRRRTAWEKLDSMQAHLSP